MNRAATVPATEPNVAAPGGLGDDAAYQAFQARDARFDGRLFVGVTSTGVYCRPVCRVRTPLRRNCRFFALAAQAERAGFRPCLRCRPELAPGLSRVDSATTLAMQAARLIDQAVSQGEPAGMATVAERLGVTDRHLRRLFTAAHGVGPHDYLTTRRLLQAKALLTDTALPVTQVAQACGFASLRRFNASFAERYGLNPSALRRDAARGAMSDADALSVPLPYRPPLDVAGLLGFLNQRCLPGVEAVAPAGLRRTLRIGSRSGWLALRFETDQPRLQLTVSPSLAPALGAVVQRVRAALDLDADPAQTASLLQSMDAPRGLRVPGAFDGFETAVRIVLGQQITVAAAATLAARLVARFGEPIDTPWPALNRLFPTAAALASADAEAIGLLGIIRQRVRTLQALACAVAEGRLRLDRDEPVQAVHARLAGLPGIGPWTTDMLALRVYGWPDAFAAGDLGVQRALGVANAAQALAAAEPWRPWRAYALVALWQRPAPGRGTLAAASNESSPP